MSRSAEQANRSRSRLSGIDGPGTEVHLQYNQRVRQPYHPQHQRGEPNLGVAQRNPTPGVAQPFRGIR